MAISKELFKQIKLLIPPLNGKLHKGQSGRVGVLGGAQDYTGAPYFAAISALRVGCDLSHVICSPVAAPALKSYAPDIIVHPILREDASESDTKSQIADLLKRLHVLIIGPGLGREDYMIDYAKAALIEAKKQDMYVVLDADGLFMVLKDFGLVRGYHKIVLTPNVVEFQRLMEALDVDPKSEPSKHASLVSRELGGVVILQKGASDIISIDTSKSESADRKDETTTVEIDVQGGLKRCGGQGDVLSGSVGAMLAWGKCYEDGAFGDRSLSSSRIPLLAAAGASMLTRTSSRLAYARMGRGLVTADVIPEIGRAFAEVFGEDAQGADKTKL